MKTTRLVLGLATLFATASPALAQGDARAAGPAGGDATRKALAEAIKAVKRIGESQPRGPEDFLAMSRRMGDEDKARAVAALAEALARAGDRDAAAGAWEDAADAAQEVGDLDDRSSVLREIAGGQAGAGLNDAALATARQAMKAARNVRPDRFGFPSPPTDGGGPELKKAVALVKVAAVQARAGDRAAARATRRQAAEAAEAVKVPRQKVGFLIEAAATEDQADAAAAWGKALEYAESLGDPLEKGQGVAAVLRARVKAGQFSDALATAENLKGDLRAFSLWVLADEAASAETPPPREVTDRIRDLAGASEFDRYYKKATLYTRLAQALARAGHASEAEKALGTLRADTPIRQGTFLQSRVELLTTIARGQVKAGAKAEARETMGVVLDLIAPFEEDWDKAFHLDQVTEAIAEAGDAGAALALAGKVPGALERVTAMTAVAAAQAAAGDRDGARKTVERAVKAAEGVPNEALWRTPGAGGMADFESGPKLRAARLIAVARARTGDVAGALEAVRALQADPSLPGKFEGIQALEEVTALQIKAGDFAGAVGTAGPARDDPYTEDKRTELLQKIARAQAEAGDAPDALAWALKQATGKAQARAILGMAEGVTAAAGKTPKGP